MTVAQLEEAVAAASGKTPCSNADPDLWFPALGDQPGNEASEQRERRHAKKVCAGCPVMAQCLRLALETPGRDFGVWGGVSEWDRRRWQRQTGTSPAVAAELAEVAR